MLTKIMLGFFVSSLLILSGCSTSEKRTKWTDKNMRVLIDADSLSSSDYVAVQTALIKNGTFTVVDRSAAFKAIKSEQERTIRTEQDRYADKEKWSQWGKLYGVGAIVVGHKQCYKAKPVFSRYEVVDRCKQFLSIVDSNTGEVLAVSEAESDAPAYVEYGSFQKPLDWTEPVEQLVDAYPRDFRPHYYSEGLERYREESAMEAQKQRDAASEKKGP